MTTNLVTVDWLNDEKQAVLVTYQRDGWTWADFYLALKEQYAFVDSVDYTVDVIVDVRKSFWLPKGGALLSGVRKVDNPHPRQGQTIIVGAKGMIAAIAKSLMKLLGENRKFHFVETMDDANALIVSLRAKRLARVS